MKKISDFEERSSGADSGEKNSLASTSAGIIKKHKVDNDSLSRRSFVRLAAAVAGGIITGANVFNTNDVAAANRAKSSKRIWIDTHIHVSDIGRDGKKRGRMLEYLLEVLDRDEADLRFVISPEPSLVKTTDPETMLSANRMVYELCRRAPGRLYGSCMVTPYFPEESLRVMKICFEEWGFVQLGEMEQYSHKFKMNDSNTEKVVRLAAKYDVPVQVHCGTWWCKGAKPGDSMDGMNQLGELLDIAERVPEAKYILAHAIGSKPNPESECVSWANMFLDTLKNVYPVFPENFWLEICNPQSPALKRTLQEVPVSQLLIGTDWTTRIGPPFQSYGTMFGYDEESNPFPVGVGSFVKFLRKAGANKAEIEQIGYGNASKLFKLSP